MAKTGEREKHFIRVFGTKANRNESQKFLWNLIEEQIFRTHTLERERGATTARDFFIPIYKATQEMNDE